MAMTPRLGLGAAACVGLVFATFAPGCGTGVEVQEGGLSASLGVEPACAANVRSVQLAVRTDGAPAFARSFPVLSAEDLPIHVAIDIPSPSGAMHEAEAIFTVAGGGTAAPIEPKVLVRFPAGTRGRVPLVLSCVAAAAREARPPLAPAHARGSRTTSASTRRIRPAAR
jgi:hypothetical protein